MNKKGDWAEKDKTLETTFLSKGRGGTAMTDEEDKSQANFCTNKHNGGSEGGKKKGNSRKTLKGSGKGKKDVSREQKCG